jgi:membrane peptidoglycan carboxypeptidase
LKPVPSLALGSLEVGVLELTTAYVPFVNSGLLQEPHGIVEVRTLDGRRLYRRAEVKGKRAIHRQIAGDMKKMLSGAVANGTGRHAAISGAKAGGKTGTSQDNRDAWFAGFAGDTVAGIWFGNDDGRPMKGVSGGGFAARAWRDFMSASLRAEKVAVRLPPPVQDSTKSEGGLEFLVKITDLVIDKIADIQDGDGTDNENRETAKGIMRWFMDTMSAIPGETPAEADQPREDIGK